MEIICKQSDWRHCNVELDRAKFLNWNNEQIDSNVAASPLQGLRVKLVNELLNSWTLFKEFLCVLMRSACVVGFKFIFNLPQQKVVLSWPGGLACYEKNKL